ncbi:MAG: DUF2279 domain-containing protein [Bacteroidota bacterium]|nr:DUF2279 domain-containing protein [Bacteroidota bacterium]
MIDNVEVFGKRCIFSAFSKKIALIFILNVLITFQLFSQSDITLKDSTVRKIRLGPVIGTESALFVTSLIGLNYTWYKDYPQSSFHFFNDNNEWQQMDKCGHMFTSYTLGNLGIQSMELVGLKHNEAIWIGGSLGFVYLLTVETLDGFSKEWGFSPGDFTANTIGSALTISQQLLWDDQRILIKWSYHSTDYPQYRPNLLGKNWKEQWLKDYNGQSYWLSFNMHSFLNKSNKFPQWLNFALGYGAEGMTGAPANPVTNEKGQTLPYFDRYRKIFLSIDIDLKRIPVKNKLLKTILNGINFIKIPSPTLGYNKKDGMKFYPIYY